MTDTRSSSPRTDVLKYIEGDAVSAQWIRAHLDYPHSEWCLLWPFGRNDAGYGLFGAKALRVHRIMCEHRHGLPPDDKPEAAHECGNGHLACVNPHHVTWKSHSDNLRDVKRERRYTLTPELVDEIRALKDRARISDIARQFGVTDNTIRQIHAGKIWKAERTDIRIFTQDEVLSVRKRCKTETITSVAKEYGVNWNTIWRIQSGKSYKWVVSEAEAAA